MKRLIFLTVGMCLLISSAQVQAQTWSPAEKEVLQAIDDCERAAKEENLEAWMACYHDDFVGFRYGFPNTLNKADFRKNVPLVWANEVLIEWWTKPLAIRIVGDVAIIHYYGYSLDRDKDGEETVLPVSLDGHYGETGRQVGLDCRPRWRGACQQH